MQYSKSECYNSNSATGKNFCGQWFSTKVWGSDDHNNVCWKKNLYQPPFSSKTLRTLNLVLSQCLKAFYKHTVTILAKNG